MYLFTARYRTQVQSILIHKDMKVSEFLDALSYSLQLPDGVIVGFQDRSGLIITPSFICFNPHEIKNEPYDVMLRSQQLSYNQNLSQTYSSPLQAHQNNQTLLLDSTGMQQQPLVNSNRLLDSQNNSYGNNFGGYSQYSAQNRSLGGDRTLPTSSQYPTAGYNYTLGNNNSQGTQNQESDMIQFINSLQNDALLTEQVRAKIIQKIKFRDSGIIGAYQLYLTDGDIEGFKARVIHRALTPPTDYNSSATTAQFNFSTSRASTAGGFRPQTRENSRIRSTFLQQNLPQNVQAHQQQQQQTAVNQDRYLPVVLELENKNMLEEQTASLLKTLILEENVEVFRVINSYIAKVISDRELSFKLTRLAQQLSNYIERPQSPLPRKKNQLLSYVNSLAKYHFSDPDDLQLLNKLIQEENEFVLSCFDVFESDKDHDNLIDSLHRILEKSKAMGLHINSMTASSFYNPNPWSRSNQHTPLYQPPGQSLSVSQASVRQQQPYISKWEERGQLQGSSLHQSQNVTGQSHFANYSNIARSTERPHGAMGGRRNMNNQAQSNQGTSQARKLPPPTQFQNTTVHNVALIPNYFSSGEEEGQGPYFQSQQQLPPRQPNNNRMQSNSNNGFNNNQLYYQQDFDQKREFEVKEEYSDDMSRLEESKNSKLSSKMKRGKQQAAQEDSEAEIIQKDHKTKKHKSDKKKSKKSKKTKGGRSKSSSSDEDNDDDDSSSSSDHKKHKSKAKQSNKKDEKKFKNKKKKRSSSSDSSESEKSDKESQDSSEESDKKKKKRNKSKKPSKKEDKDTKKKKDSKKKKEKAPKITQQQISNIIEEEEVEIALRLENFAMMQSLIKAEDQETITLFQDFLKNDDSEYLISFLESKTEDQLQYLFMKAFSNEQIALIRTLRSQRNDAIKRVFKKFKKHLDLDKLVKSLKKCLNAQNNLSPDGSGVLVNSNSSEKVKVVKSISRKEKLASVFNMIYQSEFLNHPQFGPLINQFFEEEDPRLLDSLEEFQVQNNYLILKNKVYDFLQSQAPQSQINSEKPKILFNQNQALDYFNQRGDISNQDYQLLKDLFSKRDKHFMAVWEAFVAMNDIGELLDSLTILCDVKKEQYQNQYLRVQQEAQKLQNTQEVSLFGKSQPQQDTVNNNGNSSQPQMFQMSLMKFGGNNNNAQSQNQQDSQRNGQKPSVTQAQEQEQQQPLYQKQSEDEEEGLQIEDNPDDSDNNEDINSIIEYQHKILRKYTMMGMIQYSDAPFFHDMVDQRDYKMISIFEVFAINRNEDDFLENLGLFTQLAMVSFAFDDEDGEKTEESSDNEGKIKEKEEDNPKIQILNQYIEKLDVEEYYWVKQAIREEHKHIQLALDVLKANKDVDDFIHSLKKVYKIAKMQEKPK